jgi:hypothetical protein
MNPFLAALLKDVIVPEVVALIKKHYAATGQLPTEAEYNQIIQTIVDRINTKGSELEAKILAKLAE